MAKIKSLVLKVASRCNLNCSYCYMYNMGDDTYRQQPKVMSGATVDAILERVREYCEQESITDFFLFSFHGGEPLLAGPEFFSSFVDKVRTRLPNLRSYFTIQTNGILLDASWILLFKNLNIQIGISIDGNKEENDRFRQDFAGRGSYDKVLQGVRFILEEPYHARTWGILSVVNIGHDPVSSYYHLKGLGVAQIDYLLPYSHYNALPPGLSLPLTPNSTPYGDWLIANFTAWYQDPLPRPNIRTYSGIIEAVLGGEFPTDLMGSFDNELIVVETNGSLEAVDYLKSCGEGFTKTLLNVNTHPLRAALDDPLINLYVHCHQKLAPQCLRCPVQEICGGGHLTSRFSGSKGFNNPSIFCYDLLKLIVHIRSVVLRDLPSTVVEDAGLEGLDFYQAQEAWEEISSIPNYQVVLEAFKN